MNQIQIIELRDYIQNDVDLRNMALAGQDNNIAEEINSRTSEIVSKPYMIGERGIMSALGIIDGVIFLDALDDFILEVLPPEHPLLAYQPGIKRAVKWLYDQGLDIGDPLTRTMLDTLATVGVITSTSANLVKATANKMVSYAESVNWGSVTSSDISKAIRDSEGNLLIT